MQRLGVGVVGIGWVAIQHLTAFARNPNARIVLLCSRDEGRARKRLDQEYAETRHILKELGFAR